MDLRVLLAGLPLAMATTSALAQSDPDEGVGQVVTLRPYIMVGQAQPGTGNVRLINSFDCSERCYAGVRLNAFVPGTATTRDYLIVGFGRGRQIVAQGNGAAPGGLFFGTDGVDVFGQFGIGDLGLLNSFTAVLRTEGGQGAGTGVIGPGPSGPRILLRTGTRAPDTPDGVVVSGIQQLVADADGQAVMRVALQGAPGFGLSIYQERYEGARLFIRSGEPAPGVAGATIGVSDNGPALAAGSGAVVFQGGLSTGGNGIWAGASRETIAPVAVTGRPALGAGDGVNYSSLGLQTNIGAARGRVSFVSSLAGRGVTTNNDTGLFAGTFAQPTLRVREGQQAPGLAAEVVFSTFDHQAINNEGTLLFEGRVRGPGVTDLNDTSVWRVAGGDLRLLAREGDTVPGTGGELRFGQLSRGTSESLFMNSRNDAVFEGELRGADGTARGRALFAAAAGGDVRILVRTGQQIEFGGVLRPVISLDTRDITALTPNAGNSTGGADGRRTVINRFGEVFMLLRLDGGVVGLFKAQVGVRPCPADFNRDDFVDCFDYFDFIEAFEAGRPEADVNEDEFLDFQDFNTFIGAFEEGC